jgi:hypothetical protein
MQLLIKSKTAVLTFSVIIQGHLFYSGYSFKHRSMLLFVCRVQAKVTSLGVKETERRADHLPPSNTEGWVAIAQSV